ncbi:MAG: cytochrome c [Betaproteobacteria bacterium]|nr:cytochrome c [Betaproteobacteria bacterium]
MNLISAIARCAAGAALFGLAGAAVGQQPQARSSTFAVNASMCIGCHGIPGYKTAYPEVYHVPKLAGQQQAYIVKALHAYKSGERMHASMRGIAASLSDQDIADLAAYYAGGGK